MKRLIPIIGCGLFVFAALHCLTGQSNSDDPISAAMKRAGIYDGYMTAAFAILSLLLVYLIYLLFETDRKARRLHLLQTQNDAARFAEMRRQLESQQIARSKMR